LWTVNRRNQPCRLTFLLPSLCLIPCSTSSIPGNYSDILPSTWSYFLWDPAMPGDFLLPHLGNEKNLFKSCAKTIRGEGNSSETMGR
jgi:hypothetical protein